MTLPTRALFVSRYYWPELIGSAPFSTDLAAWLSEHGVYTTVLAGLPHYPGTVVFEGYRDGSKHSELVGGSPVERLRVGPPSVDSTSARIRNEAAFLWKGLWALATGRVARHDLVLSLCPSILSVALGLAARRRGGVCVAVVHDVQSGLARTLGMTRLRGLACAMLTLERVVLNRVDLVVVLSEQMRQEQLVELAARLAVLRPDIQIVLRGSGNQVAAVAEEIRRRRLANVILDDLRAGEDLASALATGDIHLVPQNPGVGAFSLPSKIFNIMAVGRPFVATASPGSALWQLQRESGAFLCVPSNSPEAFADAVVRLADDASLRGQLGSRGRIFVEQNYAKPLVLARFMRCLDAVA
jgi:colanic acid biosynthesis glycosyl transferase WcaI